MTPKHDTWKKFNQDTSYIKLLKTNEKGKILKDMLYIKGKKTRMTADFSLKKKMQMQMRTTVEQHL